MSGTIHQQSFGYAKEAEEEDWKKRKTELLWKEFFRDPSKWWDYRNSKPSPRCPDFKHRVTGEPLWMDRRDTPSWVIEDPYHGTQLLPSFGFEKKRRTSTPSGNAKDLRWKEFFKDPSKWWDYRISKPSPRYPDFKHRVTLEPLWIGSPDTPSWVIEELRSRGDPCPCAALPGDPCQSKSQIDSFVASLRACTRNKDLVRGTSIHNDLEQRGLLQNCSHALVIMYAKCGELGKAKELLDMHKSSSNVVTWTALIAGYAREGHGQKALDCFEQMQCEGILPDAMTYACILKACAMIGAAEKGKQIHDEIERQGLLQNDIVLGGALVDMYAKCGAVSKARQVLDGLPSRNVISWSALIAGYVEGGHAMEALNCFEEMQGEGILPNALTFSSILKACAVIGAADKGKRIHDEIARQGLLQNNIVLGGALVDMYAKCGAVSKARQVLDGLPSRNVISWNALIAGYAQEGHAEQALDCFEEMQREGILPDVVSWNALIAGYAQEGHTEQALNCFEEMQREGILPDEVTCACVLNVCSHRGLVEEGQALFVNMRTKYGVIPSVECYTCMVDLFGRAGHLEKAVRLIQDMPSSDYSIIWHTLLGACRKWADVNVGRWAFERAVKLDKSDGPAYVLMENIYAAAGMGHKAENIEAMRIRNRAWKKPGRSQWINSSNVIHEFSVGDTTKQMHGCESRGYCS